MSCCAPCSCGTIAELKNMVSSRKICGTQICAGPGQDRMAENVSDNEYSDAPSGHRVPHNFASRNFRDDIFISDFIVLFFNPNIHPESEYQKRLAEQIRLCESLGVKYAVGNYDHETWLRAVSGLEGEPERGARCAACFRHRFAFGAEWARENGYNAIASVFGVSRHKDQAQVDAAANEFADVIAYLPIDWDESLRDEINTRLRRGPGGQEKSDFYRQKYCGCEFSKRPGTVL